MKKVKLLNNRPMVFIAFSLMAGIATAIFVINKSSIFWLIFSILTLFCIILFASLKKKLVALLLLCFIIGFSGHYLQYKSSVKQFADVENCFIEGKVAKVNKNKGYYSVIIKDLVVDGFKVKGKAVIKVQSENPYSVFDSISFYGTISNKHINYKNTSSITNYGNGVYYNCKIGVPMVISQGKIGLFEILHSRMTSPMSGHLTEENKGIAFSLLFGDLSSLSGDDSSAIRDTGLSHIFSVSGLHISFVVAIIALLMKKLRINKWLSILFTSVVLFLYCGITGFPPSAIRASIMALVFLLSISIYKKIDALSALALAATAMLIISPRTLFSLSFIMSVSAVFGIILFYKPLYRFFAGKTKNKLRKFVSGSFALSLSANVFLMPISINVFGSISVYFILANLFALPLVTIAYTYLFVTSVLCIFSQWFGFLYLPGNLIIELVRLIAKGVALLPYSTIRTSGLGAFSVSYVLIMVLLSRYVLLSKSQKLVASISVMFIGILLVIII